MSDGVKPHEWNWEPDLLAEPFRSIAKRTPYLIWPMWDGDTTSPTTDVSGNDRHGELHSSNVTSVNEVGRTIYSATNARIYNTTGLVATDGDIQGMTIIAGRRDTRTGTYGGIFRFGSSSQSGSLRLGYTASSAGNLRFYTYCDGADDVTNIDPTAWGRNDYHVYAAQVGWGRKKLWVDGQKIHDAAQSGDIFVYNNSGIQLGQVEYDIGGYGDNVFCYAFLEELTEDEITAIIEDPWGLVRAARFVPVAITAAELEETLEGFRWRDDDGNEGAATWAQVQDVNHTVDVNGVARLRIIIQAPSGGQYQLECALDGTENWFKIE
jgi:hypothetical protein